MQPFTYGMPDKPKNYKQMIIRAAEKHELNRRSFYLIEKFWPPKKLSSYDALMKAAHDDGVCPQDLASYINTDDYRNERLAEEDAEAREEKEKREQWKKDLAKFYPKKGI